jgi:CzcA family heavy metal efflux pump
MLEGIVAFSVRLRVLVVALSAMAIGYGLLVASRAKLDVFPEFAPPQIVVQTEAPGFSAEEVEALVTRAVESALNGTPKLAHLYSQSIQGLSVVTVVFDDEADIYRIRQLAAERLALVAASLPEGVHAPGMGALASSTSMVLTIGLTSESLSSMQLRSFADWTVRPRLSSVPGVARIEAFGGEVSQLQVQLNPARLATYGLSADEVIAATRRATGVRGAGFIETDNQRIVLRIDGQPTTSATLAEAVVARRGAISLRLRDVATVVEAPESKVGDATVMGGPGVVMGIHGQYGANTLEVTERVEQTLAELRPVLAEQRITLHPALFRPATFIETSIHNIGNALLIGGCLVILVLVFFLANWRSAFIAIITIPISLLIALVVLDRFGVSINTITLGGFAIAIGVVVDDAIIGLENVWRRLRENLGPSTPLARDEVIIRATLEVRSPVVYATFIVAAVFWPILMMSGVNGRLFAPLAVSFVLATAASLVVAITLTPALCSLLAQVADHQPNYIQSLKRLHLRLLERINTRPRTVIAATAVSCVAAIGVLPFLGGEFLPEFKEAHYVARVSMAPGTSTIASTRMGARISEALLKVPNVSSVAQQIGRAEQGEDTAGPEFSEFHIQLAAISGEEEEATQELIRRTLGEFPGISFALTPFLEERIEEILSGGRGQVVVNLFGEDLELLDSATHRVRQIVESTAGATDVFTEVQSGAPELRITLRADRLRQYGFMPADLLEQIESAYQGLEVAEVNARNHLLNVVVVLEPRARRDVESIRELVVRNPSGNQASLGELAYIDVVAGRHVIFREGARRRRQVSFNAEDVDVQSLAATLEHKIRAETLPPGVSMDIGGAARARNTARDELLLHSLFAVVAVVLLLSLVLANVRNVLLVLANVPFALAGGVLILVVTGVSLSVGAMVGFVSLFGISMRNSILMISHYEELITNEGRIWGIETAFRGAQERLLPILMTALVVALGLLPVALGSEEAGKEIEGPMAIVILGGLATSTILNLFVLPVLALRYANFAKQTASTASSSPSVKEA